jgi:hypothetical protein
MTPNETRRLAFIKYLLTLANQQVKQPEPLANVALLQFHDATELFLHLAAEHLNVTIPQRTNFMDYWGHIGPQVAPAGLPQQASMSRLTRARNDLKHAGIMPSRQDLQGFAEATNRFFEDATPLVFGQSLDSVSLVDFVACEPARQHLEDAVQGREAGDAIRAINGALQAFNALLGDYEDRKRDSWHHSPFDFGESLFRLSHSFFQLGLDREMEPLEEALKELSHTVKMLVLGVDYRRYARFQYVLGFEPGEIRREHMDFTIDFVLDTALRLQEFDYDVERFPVTYGQWRLIEGNPQADPPEDQSATGPAGAEPPLP